MLTAEQINALRDKAAKLAAPIQAYLLREIVRRVAHAGQLTSTAAYQVWKAQQLGVSQRQIKQELRRLLRLSHKEIRRIMYQSAQSGYNLDVSRFPQVQAVPFERNTVLQQIVSAAAELAQDDFTNLTQTIGFVAPNGRPELLTKAYIDSCDFAFQLVSTGAADYMTAIRQATKNLADKGIRAIDYESGVHTSLEAAVRRNIMGGLGLMQEKIIQETHDQLGCNGWEITAHANSAPDHEPIQGRQYSDEAYTALNNSLRRRIGTLNCGHAAFPIILGVNKPQYTAAELEKFRQDNAKGVTIDGKHYTGYQATQMQRSLERAIRKQKNRVMVDEAAGDSEKLKTDKAKLTVLRQRYKEFSEAAELRTQYERTEVAGFGKWERQPASQSANRETTAPGIPEQIGTVDFSDKQAVLARLDAAQRETVGLDHEVNHTVTADGKVWRVSGDSGAVNSSAIPSNLAGSYSYHNHPTAKTWFSFSASDVRFFFESGAVYSKASDQMYEYVMQRTPETLAVEPEIVYHRFKELYSGDVMELSFDEKIDIDRDGFHETMIRLSKEYHFFYERMKLNDG